MTELSGLSALALAVVLVVTVLLSLGACAQAAESLGWKPHLIRQGDGQGGWILKAAEYQCLQQSYWGPSKAEWKAFGLAQMDNGEIVLVGSCESEEGGEDTVIAFSSDRGNTWSELEPIPGVAGRPMMLAYLGGGDLTFFSGGQRYFSSDYGRTWAESIPVQPVSDGAVWGNEGNPLVDQDTQGRVTRMAETLKNPGSGERYLVKHGYVVKQEPHALIRWSDDGGRTWTDEVRPQEWSWQETYEGQTYTRWVSEGSLVRAQNGWIVAALRPDMPVRYAAGPHSDQFEGTGVSVSEDEGRTWSPLSLLFPSGRMHADLRRLSNGDLVMTVTVRLDMQDGELVSYRRGCEAIISHDNGLTWDLARRYILDEWQFLDYDNPHLGSSGHLCSVLLDDGSILTAHNNYLSKGISLIRWRP